ncbi:MAG: gliding motility-associated C-terminal domain-containing protein [Chitinophagales bacterium]|nr:gliding motility-associated C-terminal domain-containing protein [Chitinophagales bacterium]
MRIWVLFLGFLVPLVFWGQCSTYCSGNIGIYSTGDAESIAYDALQVGYHNVLSRDENNFYAQGQIVLNGILTSPKIVDENLYPWIKAKVKHGTIYSNSLVFLTDSGIIHINNGIFPSRFLSNTNRFNFGNSYNLPGNYTPDDIKMMFSANRTLFITTCDGFVFSLSQDFYANGGDTTTINWIQIMEAPNVPLSNVIACRGISNRGYALKRDGTLWTWGRSVYLGNGTGRQNLSYATQMTKPSDIGPIKMIGMTNGPSYYVLDTLGKLYALGQNAIHQLGDLTNTERTVWIRPKYPDNSIMNDISWFSASKEDIQCAILNKNKKIFVSGSDFFGTQTGSFNFRLLAGDHPTYQYDFVATSKDMAILNTSNSSCNSGHIGCNLGKFVNNSNSTSPLVDVINTQPISVCKLMKGIPIFNFLDIDCNSQIAKFKVIGNKGMKIYYSKNSSQDTFEFYLNDQDTGTIVFQNFKLTDTINIINYNYQQCQNILNYKIPIGNPIYKVNTVKFCKVSTHYYRGNLINKDTVFLDSFLKVNGCDSILKTIIKIDYYKVIKNILYCFSDSIYHKGTLINKDTIIKEYSQGYLDRCDTLIEYRYKSYYLPEKVENVYFCLKDSIKFNDKLILKDTVILTEKVEEGGCLRKYRIIYKLVDFKINQLNIFCVSDSIYIGGRLLLKDTTYQEIRKSLTGGCDTIYEIFYKSLNKYENLPDVTVCQDTLNPKHKESKIYYTPKPPILNDCPTIQVQRYNVLPAFYLDSLKYICQGNTFLGMPIFRDTTLKLYSKTQNGCDSHITYQVKSFKDNNIYSDTLYGCTFIVLPNGDTIRQNLTQTITLQNQYLCDSFVNYTTILENKPEYFSEDRFHCGYGLSPLGDTLIGDTSITSTYLNAFGCDSIVKINYTIKPNFLAIIDTVIGLEPFYFLGKKYDSSGIFFDTLVTMTGCDSVFEIRLRKSDDIFLYNGFSPNNDDYNEVYFIPNALELLTIHWQILNRQGQVLFETKDPEGFWDGTFEGAAQPSGSYLLLIDYTNKKGERKYQQMIIALIR